jgi:hypothetical protein
MILNFTQVTPPGNAVMTFPDTPNPAQPANPDSLVETTILPASSITTISIGGSVDSVG